jgi:hypothetical protein
VKPEAKMSKWLWVLPILVIMAAVLAFLSMDKKERSEAMQPQPAQNGKEQTMDDLLLEVARRVPEFGGLFIDEQDRLAVYLLDLTKSAAAEEAIVDVFGRERIPPGGIQAIQGQYGFLQLKEWYDRMGAVFRISGVTISDIDEAKNRLKVGLERIDKRELVEQQLSKLGIPLQAVIIEETGPIRPLETR